MATAAEWQKKKKSTTYLIDKAQVKLGMALETIEFGIMGALCVCVCVPMHCVSVNMRRGEIPDLSALRI